MAVPRGPGYDLGPDLLRRPLEHLHRHPPHVRAVWLGQGFPGRHPLLLLLRLCANTAARGDACGQVRGQGGAGVRCQRLERLHVPDPPGGSRRRVAWLAPLPFPPLAAARADRGPRPRRRNDPACLPCADGCGRGRCVPEHPLPDRPPCPAERPVHLGRDRDGRLLRGHGRRLWHCPLADQQLRLAMGLLHLWPLRRALAAVLAHDGGPWGRRPAPHVERP